MTNELTWKRVWEATIYGKDLFRYEAYHQGDIAFTIAKDLIYGGWYAVRGKDCDAELAANNSLVSIAKQVKKLFAVEQKEGLTS